MKDEKEKIKGVVKFFNGNWGFIIALIDGEEQDIFCHEKDILVEAGVLLLIPLTFAM